MSASPPTDPLARFSLPTREWFAGTFSAPTPAQDGAWSAIADGHNTLVIAPTGSGKTLAAFLWALDSLGSLASAAGHERVPGTQVLYVSPLKALAVDVERNLRAPLSGITWSPSGEASPFLRSAWACDPVTPARAAPPAHRTAAGRVDHNARVAVLMLTSAARQTLSAVRTVIVDEVHAIAGTKRGAHLALSLERLDQLLPRPAQRIGLSATVRPPEEVARFLSGQSPTTVVAPRHPRPSI